MNGGIYLDNTLLGCSVIEGVQLKHVLFPSKYSMYSETGKVNPWHSQCNGWYRYETGSVLIKHETITHLSLLLNYGLSMLIAKYTKNKNKYSNINKINM